MPDFLSEGEVRVLGCLIEKQMSTPEYYPMTLNALVNACNQKTNRLPVVSFDEAIVQTAVDGLRRKGLASQVQRADSRAQKYGHTFTDRYDLGAREIALLCELMLRGPQTPGELRNRSERLCSFQGLEEVDNVLSSLMDQPEPLVLKLPRQPGQKEQRFTHLFCSAPGTGPQAETLQVQPSRPESGEDLVSVLNEIRQELKALKAELAEFKARFE